MTILIFAPIASQVGTDTHHLTTTSGFGLSTLVLVILATMIMVTVFVPNAIINVLLVLHLPPIVIHAVLIGYLLLLVPALLNITIMDILPAAKLAIILAIPVPQQVAVHPAILDFSDNSGVHQLIVCVRIDTTIQVFKLAIPVIKLAFAAMVGLQPIVKLVTHNLFESYLQLLVSAQQVTTLLQQLYSSAQPVSIHA